MINQGFFLWPQSGAAQWPQTSKLHQICGAPNLIEKEIPLSVGVKYAIIVLGTVRDGQFAKIIVKFKKNDQPYRAQDNFQEIFYPLV